ncbi:MAG: hypothetical protein P9L94_14330 [Candidatus Hinthialibacter antarcticus]|nr:hypothetical protein [Candidatus Hinthialibacter antarcticus]
MNDEQRVTLIPPEQEEHRVYHQTVVVQNQGSFLFPIITLLFTLFMPPIGIILNLIGLITGPNRGCFLAMIIFLVIPGLILSFFLLSLFGFTAFLSSF